MEERGVSSVRSALLYSLGAKEGTWQYTKKEKRRNDGDKYFFFRGRDPSPGLRGRHRKQALENHVDKCVSQPPLIAWAEVLYEGY